MRPEPGRARKARAWPLNPRRRRARSDGGSARARRSLPVPSVESAASSSLAAGGRGGCPRAARPCGSHPGRRRRPRRAAWARPASPRRDSPRAARSSAARAPSPSPDLGSRRRRSRSRRRPARSRRRSACCPRRCVPWRGRRCAACRGSAARPRTPTPSSRNPFRSSAERPLIFSMRWSLARFGVSTAASGSARAQQQLVEAVELGLVREGHADLASAATAPRDLDRACRARRAAVPRPRACSRPCVGRPAACAAHAAARHGAPPRAPRAPCAPPRARASSWSSARSRASSARAWPASRRALRDQLAQLARQAQQAQRVGDRRALASHAPRDLLLCQVELVLQALEGLRLLEARQLLCAGCSRRGPARGASRRARRAAVTGTVASPAACAARQRRSPRDDLEAFAAPPHQDRLHDPVLADRRP